MNDLDKTSTRDGGHLLLLEPTGLSPHDAVQPELFDNKITLLESIASKLKEQGLELEYKALTGCHRFESVRWCRKCGRSHVVFNHCDRRICPLCAPVIAQKRAETLEWWTATIQQPKHVVLTCRNKERLTKAGVRKFCQNLTLFRRTRFCRGWRGGFTSVELTNESRGWHLHAHSLVDADWIDQSELAVKWGQQVGQDFAVVWVKDGRETNYRKQVLKYTVDSANLAQWPANEIKQFVRAFRGIRVFTTWGSAYRQRQEFAAWKKATKEIRNKCECGWKFDGFGRKEEYELWFDQMTRRRLELGRDPHCHDTSDTPAAPELPF